jgi:hypothetical protein
MRRRAAACAAAPRRSASSSASISTCTRPGEGVGSEHSAKACCWNAAAAVSWISAAEPTGRRSERAGARTCHFLGGTTGAAVSAAPAPPPRRPRPCPAPPSPPPAAARSAASTGSRQDSSAAMAREAAGGRAGSVEPRTTAHGPQPAAFLARACRVQGGEARRESRRAAAVPAEGSVREARRGERRNGSVRGRSAPERPHANNTAQSANAQPVQYAVLPMPDTHTAAGTPPPRPRPRPRPPLRTCTLRRAPAGRSATVAEPSSPDSACAHALAQPVASART